VNRRRMRADRWPLVDRRRSDLVAPSTYSLTCKELRAEAERLRVAGWSPWEVAARLERAGP
jgi:hypothetical protein